MGGACCTCSEESKYRFKGFVVSVYPDDVKGGPDEEALGKLTSYVASNPERIPRVCRKITKIMRVHLQARKTERVMVSVRMLLSLIQHAKSVDGFVPHSIEICAVLLATDDTRYKVGAAGILSALCSRLVEDARSEPSRRLIADSKDRLLPPLQVMCSVTTTKDGGAPGVYTVPTTAAVLQVRYAAVVALGHTARCLNGALASNAVELFFPVVDNVLSILRSRAGRPVEAGASFEEQLFDAPAGTSGGAVVAVPDSVELPPETKNPDLAYARAGLFAAGAIASTVTAANVEGLTEALIVWFRQTNAWATPTAPVVIVRALVAALQGRPQGSGFTALQPLCAAGTTNTDPVVRIGILRAIEACLDILPMSGRRPQLILAYLRGAFIAAPVDDRDANTKPTLDALVAVTGALMKAVYSQGNAPQLQSVLSALAQLLADCSAGDVEPTAEAEEGHSRRRSRPTGARSRTYLALRCMAAASPYVRSAPLVDRRSGALDVCNVIEPFLNSTNDAHRTWAARILRGVLAGMPQRFSSGEKGRDAAAAAGAAVLCTDELDVAFAESWVKAIVQDAATVTPRCVVEVGNVLTAIMAGYGIHALPFVLTTLWALQSRCASGSGGAPDANSSNMVSSTAPSSPLSRAWLHMIVAVLASCGTVYEMPKMAEYAADIIARRAALQPSELATCFEAALRPTARPEHRFSACGLAVARGSGGAGRKDAPLSAAPSLPPVTRLPSFSYVANIIVDAHRADTVAVFGAASPNDLKAAIERVCFGPESEVNVSVDHESILSAAAPSSRARGGPANAFALAVSKDRLAALDDLRVLLVDSSATPGPVQNSTAAAAAAGAERDAPSSLNLSSNPQRIQAVLEKLSVDASTSLLPPDAAEAPPQPPPFAVDAAALNTDSPSRSHRKTALDEDGLGSVAGTTASGSEPAPVSTRRHRSRGGGGAAPPPARSRALSTSTSPTCRRRARGSRCCPRRSTWISSRRPAEA